MLNQTTKTHPVQQSGDPPELQKLVTLQSLGQLDRIVLVVRLQTAPQSDVILLLDQKIVVRLVDHTEVELLRSDQVWLGERQVVLLGEDLDNSRVVQSRCKSGKEVREEVGLVGQVEGDGFVGDLHIGNLDRDLLELVVVPLGQSLHHGKSRIVRFIWVSADGQGVWTRFTVDNVQEDKLRPKVRLLSSTNDFRLHGQLECLLQTDELTMLVRCQKVLRCSITGSQRCSQVCGQATHIALVGTWRKARSAR